MLKLTKRFHPDFVTRNKKPLGSVTIDWNNPLSRDLKWFAWTDRGGLCSDLVSDTFHVRAPKGYTNTLQGAGLSIQDNDNDGVELLGTAAPEPTHNEVTMAAYVRWDETASSGNQTILFLNSPGNEFTLRLTQTSGGFSYGFNAAYVTVAANRSITTADNTANFKSGQLFSRH